MDSLEPPPASGLMKSSSSGNWDEGARACHVCNSTFGIFNRKRVGYDAFSRSTRSHCYARTPRCSIAATAVIRFAHRAASTAKSLTALQRRRKSATPATRKVRHV